VTTHSQSPVTPLRRPPVRQATLVRSDLCHTFEVFVRELSVWWPVQPFSAGQDRVRTVTVERRVGGRVYEAWEDGTDVEWGELLDWRPPHGFTMTWAGTPAPTKVELTFTELGPALTRVAVEHRGWEALNDAQLSGYCALPGGCASGSYTEGWATILGCLSAKFEAKQI
jgi:Activator of Hsp90 ATPase homolog 1-like protein